MGQVIWSSIILLVHKKLQVFAISSTLDRHAAEGDFPSKSDVLVKFNYFVQQPAPENGEFCSDDGRMRSWFSRGVVSSFKDCRVIRAED